MPHPYDVIIDKPAEGTAAQEALNMINAVTGGLSTPQDLDLAGRVLATIDFKRDAGLSEEQAAELVLNALAIKARLPESSAVELAANAGDILRQLRSARDNPAFAAGYAHERDILSFSQRDDMLDTRGAQPELTAAGRIELDSIQKRYDGAVDSLTGTDGSKLPDETRAALKERGKKLAGVTGYDATKLRALELAITITADKTQEYLEKHGPPSTPDEQRAMTAAVEAAVKADYRYGDALKAASTAKRMGLTGAAARSTLGVAWKTITTAPAILLLTPVALFAGPLGRGLANATGIDFFRNLGFKGLMAGAGAIILGKALTPVIKGVIGNPNADMERAMNDTIKATMQETEGHFKDRQRVQSHAVSGRPEPGSDLTTRTRPGQGHAY